MNKETKEIIASNLTIAFYSAQEPRRAFIGIERRKKDKLEEGLRDLRENILTSREVFEVFERFLSMLNSKKNS